MEFLLVGFFSFVGIVLAIDYFKKNIKVPGELRGAELEMAWIEVKAKLLVPSPSIEARTKLFSRSSKIYAAIIERHRRYLDDVQADPAQFSWVGQCLTELSHAPYEPSDKCVTSNLPLDNLTSELIMFLCIISQDGALLNTFGRISSNHWFLNRGVEHLVSVRNYPPGILLKGLVFKYGVDVASPIRLGLAREFLSRASKFGVGGALLELEHIDLHSGIDEISRRVGLANDWLEGAALLRKEQEKKDWVRG